ncbi:MAG TPA: M28 family peptidase [Gemmatimonadales bacterium]|nr:M28 family peptidase [Gemmatimonadales bacterium]
MRLSVRRLAWAVRDRSFPLALFRPVLFASPFFLPLSFARAQDGASVGAAAASITAGDIARRIAIIAHDSMRGRATPSPELDEVAAYVAGEFRRFGLKPLGDGGTFLQRYGIELVRVDTARSGITVAGGPTFHIGRDVAIPLPRVVEGRASGPAVLVSGSGDPARLDVQRLRGAVVLAVVPAAPGGGVSGAGSMLIGALIRSEAAAVIAVAPVSDSVWASYRPVLSRTTLRPEWERTTGKPLVIVRDRTIAPLLAQRGLSLADARRDAALKITEIADLRLTVTVTQAAVSRASGPNVVGLLDGSDPALRREYLVYSAHMDHVGVPSSGLGCRAQGADSICNGADDDASGTIAVVELAEAFATLRPAPRRSIIFLGVSGEERGLWGSEYFAREPPVPLGQIVANLNVDMVGRNWRDTIVAIGKEHSDLGATLERVNAAHPELTMTAIDDIWPEERFYFRSDHYNFARNGVPVLFFFNGVHADYHRPGDHADKIDAEKESRIAKLLFYLGLEIANAADRPKWKPESYRQIVEPGARR